MQRHRSSFRRSLRIARTLLDRYPNAAFNLVDHLIAQDLVDRADSALSVARTAWRREPTGSPARHLPDDEFAALREHVPAYRDRPTGCPLRAQPALARSDLEHRPEDLLDRRFATGRQWLKSTSGTTGSSVDVRRSAEFHFANLFLTVPRILRVAGVESAGCDVLCVSLRDWVQSYVSVWVDPWGEDGALVQAPVYDQRTLDEAIHTVRELSPTCVATTPAVLEQLVEAHDAAETVWLPPVVIVSGSQLPSRSKRRAERVLGTRVVDAYAMSEFGTIASSCRMDDGLHVHAGLLDVEVVDSTEGGPGELIVSDVRNAAMPLLRYRTGDRALLEEAPCRCGQPGPRLRGLSGHEIPNLRLRSGRLVSTAALRAAVHRIPVAVRELAVDDGTLRLVVESLSAAPVADHRAAVVAGVGAVVGDETDVVVEPAPRDGTSSIRGRTEL